MQYQRAGVDIPDGRNLVAIQIQLRGFCGTPIRSGLRKLSHNQRFDVRTRSLFVVKIGADISYVWIGEANNLAGVTWIGENFLVPGEAGIKNDFAAAARNRAGRAAIK
jgi:hypothetical protein